MELRDLYDNNRILTGEVIEKDSRVPDERNILVVLIWIQNSKNEFLIQKRSLAKGGDWGATGGHPKHGEDSKQGMITETKEELGYDIRNENVILYYSSHMNNRFFDLYYLEKDIELSTLTCQVEEVSEIKWASAKEIEELYAKGLFKDSHYMTFTHLKEYLKSKVFF